MTENWTFRLRILSLGLAVAACLGAGTAVSARVRASVPQGADHAAGIHSAAATSSSSRCWSPRTEERGFTRAMNDSRAGAGRGRLRLDPELSKAARVHTREMVAKTLLHHTSAPTLSQRVTRWNLLGENVGVGNTVDSLHSAFMGSPAHRANVMLSSFRYVGVGTASAGGRLWVTVVFENRIDPGTRLKMPRC